jgi:hypothetical protein
MNVITLVSRLVPALLSVAITFGIGLMFEFGHLV